MLEVVALRTAVCCVYRLEVVAFRTAVCCVYRLEVVALRTAVCSVYRLEVVALRMAVCYVYRLEIVTLRTAVCYAHRLEVVAFRTAVLERRVVGRSGLVDKGDGLFPLVVRSRQTFEGHFHKQVVVVVCQCSTFIGKLISCAAVFVAITKIIPLWILSPSLYRYHVNFLRSH